MKFKSISDSACEWFLKEDKKGRKRVACCEGGITLWFEKNFRKLGYSRILKKQHNKTPDFIMLRDGREVKVEIEFMASDFIQHGHRRDQADVVICCSKDVELEEGIEVITLDHIFVNYWGEVYPIIDPTKRKVTVEDMRELVEF